jgi:transposase
MQASSRDRRIVPDRNRHASKFFSRRFTREKHLLVFLLEFCEIALAPLQRLAMLSDMNETTAIPNDLIACQTLIDKLAKTIQEQTDTITKLKNENAELNLEINELLQQAFRRRSERYIQDPNQLKLDFGNTPGVADAADGLADAVQQAELIVAEHKRRKRSIQKPRHEGLPEHLPRYEVEAAVPEEVKNCASHGERKLIGHDRIETLEMERPKLKVRVTLIPKYVCAGKPECGVAEPPRQIGLVEGNRYGTSIAAEIITGKYGYHLPIYRQQDYFAGCGWTPNRSTLLNILSASAAVLHPFTVYLRGEVLNSELIGTDDTPVTLLLPADIPQAAAGDAKSQRIHQVFSEARAEGKPSVAARMWVYRSLLIPISVFDFTVSRHRDGPDEFLVASEFHGTLMADCYSGYQGITMRSDARIQRGACNAHARRKVYEAREAYPLLSSQLLAMYQELYDIEDRAGAIPITDRQALRDREARPVWDRMRKLMDSDAASQVLPKDKFGQALGYLRNQWEALQKYLSDGRLPIDNNAVEQLMKQVAIGRKNWLFIGSVAAGERAADLLTLVSSAVRNDLDVWAYVKEVLDRLLSGDTDYASLRPDRWGEAHPEAIRTYRQQERRNRADGKRFQRAHRRLTQSPPQTVNISSG